MSRGSSDAIARSLEANINAGELSPGDKLVPVRELADELGVSPSTVNAAYRRLRERGLVIGRGRQGTRVAPLTPSGAAAPAPSTAGLIDAMNGTPDGSLLPDLAAALAVASQVPQAGYGDALIVDELHRAATDHFEADDIDARHLTVTSGSMDAVERVLRAQGLRTGDRVGVEDPGHVPLHQVVRSAGQDVVPIEIDDEGLLPDSLVRALKLGLAALVVTPRCQNPTGAAFTPQRAKVITGVLAKHPSVVLIVDDHAGDISGVPYVAPAPPTGPTGPTSRWAIIRSMGKSFGPDLRLAVVAGDATTIERVSIGFANGPGWVSHVLQRATAHLMTDPASLATVGVAAETYADRRRALIDALADRGIAARGPSGLNVWVPTTDEQALVERARVAGFAIRGGDTWRINSEPAVRVTISHLANDQMPEIADALAPSPSPRSSASV